MDLVWCARVALTVVAMVVALVFLFRLSANKHLLSIPLRLLMVAVLVHGVINFVILGAMAQNGHVPNWTPTSRMFTGALYVMALIVVYIVYEIGVHNGRD